MVIVLRKMNGESILYKRYVLMIFLELVMKSMMIYVEVII